MKRVEVLVKTIETMKLRAGDPICLNVLAGIRDPGRFRKIDHIARIDDAGRFKQLTNSHLVFFRDEAEVSIPLALIANISRAPSSSVAS